MEQPAPLIAIIQDKVTWGYDPILALAILISFLEDFRLPAFPFAEQVIGPGDLVNRDYREFSDLCLGLLPPVILAAETQAPVP